jgi:GT2 family glycosyltransferase
MPIVACVILNYNDSETTKVLLQNIEKYDSINYIIVVDNCSTDNSFSKLKHFETDRLKVIQANRNRGYGAGNNIGVSYAKEEFSADYVIIANPDVYFNNKFVKNCIEALEEDHTVAIVTGTMLDKNGEFVVESTWCIPSIWGELVDASSLLRRIFQKSKRKSARLTKDNCKEYVEVVSGSLFIVDIEKFQEVGLFDEDIFLYGEENILAIKMKKAGYRELKLNSNQFIHLHSISIDKEYKNMLAKRRLLVKSKRIILTKYYDMNKLTLVLLKSLLGLTILEASIIEIGKVIFKKRN